jgi:hypothetical protein
MPPAAKAAVTASPMPLDPPVTSAHPRVGKPDPLWTHSVSADVNSAPLDALDESLFLSPIVFFQSFPRSFSPGS